MGDDLGAIQRGRTFADAKCTACHAVSGRAPGLTARAPAFTIIAGRYTVSSLERELDAIAEVGHYETPALMTSPEDRAAVVAYMPA